MTHSIERIKPMGNEEFIREVLNRFDRICEETYEEQKKLLGQILQDNKDTEFGQKYHFGDIRNVDEFRQQVPLSQFKDYEEDIERQIQGEQGVLTAEKPVFYCISAGSTGVPKYLPISLEDVRHHFFYEEGVVRGVIREAFPELGWEEIFGCTLELGEFFRTCMEDGTPNGVRSGIYFRYAQENNTFDVSSYGVPWDVFFPEKVEDILYVKVRFALDQEKVTGIHGVFAHKMLRTFRFIEKNWELLLHDMESGRVSPEFGISKDWEEFLLHNLPANPGRAADLRRISGKDFPSGMLKKIWPSLKYLRVIGGKMFQLYTDRIKVYADQLPIHFFAYAASESYLGVAEKMNCPDAYTLLADTCFYEFLPSEERREKEDARPLAMWEVETGKQYELVITTLSGLYRYHLGDVVEIVGWKGKAPVVRICGRIGQGLNLADENMNVSQLETAVREFGREMGIHFTEYCFLGEYQADGPGYRLCLEMDKALPQDAEQRLDAQLGKASFGYKSARDMGELSMARVTLVSADVFLAFEREKEKQGARTEQKKPTRILREAEDRRLFLKLLDRENTTT